MTATRRTNETRRYDANLVKNYNPAAVWDYRRKAGLSERMLAQGIGVKEADIFRWEDNTNRSGIPYTTLMAMARMLECTVDELLL